MANSIANAPAILAESVIASLKGKLPALRAFSSVFTAAESGAGKTVQVPLIGTSTATEFSTGGYLTQDDATITAANVTLKHFKVSSRFSPLDVKMYGAAGSKSGQIETILRDSFAAESVCWVSSSCPPCCNRWLLIAPSHLSQLSAYIAPSISVMGIPAGTNRLATACAVLLE